MWKWQWNTSCPAALPQLASTETPSAPVAALTARATPGRWPSIDPADAGVQSRMDEYL